MVQFSVLAFNIWSGTALPVEGEGSFASVGEGMTESDAWAGPHKIIAGPINLVRRSFQKKSTALPVEGVGALCQLVHRVIRDHEEVALQVNLH